MEYKSNLVQSPKVKPSTTSLSSLLESDSLMKTASVAAKSGSTKFLPRVWEWEEQGVTKWQGFFIIRQNSLDCLNLVCPDQTEQKLNCPICCQNHPHRLQRIPAQEGEIPGVERGSRASYQPLQVSRGWMRSYRLSSQLTPL